MKEQKSISTANKTPLLVSVMLLCLEEWQMKNPHAGAEGRSTWEENFYFRPCTEFKTLLNLLLVLPAVRASMSTSHTVIIAKSLKDFFIFTENYPPLIGSHTINRETAIFINLTASLKIK